MYFLNCFQRQTKNGKEVGISVTDNLFTILCVNLYLLRHLIGKDRPNSRNDDDFDRSYRVDNRHIMDHQRSH